MTKRWMLLLLALCLALSPVFASASMAVDEDDHTHYTLPISDTPGQPVDERFFLSNLEYEDPTLKFVITSGQWGGCTYWLADIEISDASQLRTTSADGWDSNGVTSATRMAQRMNAVLAINGDYFSFRGIDYVIRMGTSYLNHLRGTRDVLVIDEDGDFHGFEAPERKDIPETIDGKKIINGFFFGPLIVNNGKVRQGGYSGQWMAADTQSQRMAIAQVGHLKYRVICVGPPVGKDNPKGLTLEKFRQFVSEMEDVQVAYNLDGGDSTYLIVNGQKVNYPENSNARDIADIIYFASAYSGAQ